MHHVNYLITAILLYILPCWGFGQSPPIEPETPKRSKYLDSLEADRLFERSWALRHKDIDSSYRYAQRSLQLSQKWGFRELEAYSLGAIGKYYGFKNRSDSAMLFQKKSLLIRKRHLNPRTISGGYHNVAMLFKEFEQYDSASHYFRLALSCIPEDEHLGHRSKLLDGLGMTLLEQGSYQLAEKQLAQALSLAQIEADSALLGPRFHNFGIFYQTINRPKKALIYYAKALEIYTHLDWQPSIADILLNTGGSYLKLKNYKMAIEILKKCQRVSDQFISYYNKEELLNNLGLAYHATNQLDSAERSFNSGLQLSLTNEKSLSLIKIGINLMRLKLDQQQGREALQFASQVEHHIQSDSLFQYLPDFLDVRSDAYAATGQYDLAFADRLRYTNIQDSLNALIDDAQELAAEMELSRVEQDKLRTENELQRTALEKREAEARVNQWIVLALALAILVLLLFFYLRNRTLNLRNQALKERQQGEERRMEILEKMDLALLEKQVEAESNASFRIGQDLHDRLGAKLSVAQMSIPAIRDQLAGDPVQAADRLAEIEGLLEESCDDVRTVSHDLMDRKLRERGVLNELQQYLDMIPTIRDMDVEFIHLDVPDDLPEHLQKEITAIIRILVNNVLRHARASQLTVQLIRDNGHLSMTVEDNGRGFDPNEVSPNASRGLSNARLRATRLGGELNLNSKPGKGTSALFHLPLKPTIP